MEAIIIYPKSKKQIRAFEQMAKALDIPFEIAQIKKQTERNKAIEKEPFRGLGKPEALKENGQGKLTMNTGLFTV